MGLHSMPCSADHAGSCSPLKPWGWHQLRVVTAAGVWPVKMQLNISVLAKVLKLGVFAAYESCLQVGIVSGSSQQEGVGIFQVVFSQLEGRRQGWCCKAEAFWVPDLQRVVAWWDDSKQSTEDVIECCAVWTCKRALCAVSLAYNTEIPSLSHSAYFLSCLKSMARLSLLLFPQVGGQPAASSCVSKLWDMLF